MAIDLFAGIPVSDYAAASAWYERLFGGPPAFHPNMFRAADGNEVAFGGEAPA